MYSTKRLSWTSAWRPTPGSWFHDFCRVVGLFFVQDTILGAIPFGGLQLDLLSVYVIYAAAFRTMGRAAWVAGLAAYLLETHSAAPIGLYGCVYGALVVILQTLRHHISWHQISTWLMMVFCTELILFLFTCLLIQSYALELDNFPLVFWIEAGCKFVGSVAVGTLLLGILVHEKRESWA